jgi:hypothetical protein
MDVFGKNMQNTRKKSTEIIQVITVFSQFGVGPGALGPWDEASWHIPEMFKKSAALC